MLRIKAEEEERKRYFEDRPIIQRWPRSTPVEQPKSYWQPTSTAIHYAQDCPGPEVGMKILHENYGELTILKVEKKENQTIIYVVDSNGEKSSKVWNVLWAHNKIKII